MKEGSRKFHVGILGTSMISRNGLIIPADSLQNIVIDSIGSRNLIKSLIFSKKYNIPKYCKGYDKLIADPEIDIIYNSLPNGLHTEWNIKSIRSKKHVICEKPIASNSNEALKIKKEFENNKVLLMEAFHYRYHPLFHRINEIIKNDELGKIQDISAKCLINIRRKSDIRYNFDLGGGSLLDVGCYAINITRTLIKEEPKIDSAYADIFKDQIDTFFHGELYFPSGIKGIIESSLANEKKTGSELKIKGNRGTLSCSAPFSPYGGVIDLRLKNKKSKIEKLITSKQKSTYYFQLVSFLQSINDKKKIETNINDAVKNLKVIDELYKKAGLKPRGT